MLLTPQKILVNTNFNLNVFSTTAADFLNVLPSANATYTIQYITPSNAINISNSSTPLQDPTNPNNYSLSFNCNSFASTAGTYTLALYESSINNNNNPVNAIVQNYYLDVVDNGSSPACFKEGTKILTRYGYKLIQDLKQGDLIKTINHSYVPISMIGKTQFYHDGSSSDRTKNKLYICKKSKFPNVFEDLVITGCHSILVDKFDSDEQKSATVETLGTIYVTGRKYRMPACVDPRSAVYDQTGSYTIYHIALENDNNYFNYGIYANGLLVESCSKYYLKERSGMTLICGL
jgi:hypothetical protein